MTLQYVCDFRGCSNVLLNKEELVTIKVWTGIASLSTGQKSIKQYHFCNDCFANKIMKEVK